MANNSDDIRRILNLMESVAQTTLLEGWVSNLADKFNGKSLGNKERAQMADELKKEYYQWLGQTNRSGTIDDMNRFMTHRVGFNDSDIDTVLSKAGVTAPEAEAEPEADADQKIKTGAELGGKKKPGFDPEEGVPVPDNLDTKMSDFKDLGIEKTKADNKEEPQEVIDNPKKYQLAGGDWDRKKISKKLDGMPLGAKLTLGQTTFARTVGDDATDFYNDRADGVPVESINEAAAEGVLDKQTVAAIMDATAARVNDEYLLNGPERDKDINAGMAGGRNGNGNGYARNQSQAGRKPSENKPGKAGSGQYDSQEMVDILKRDFDIKNAKSFVDSLTRKVMQNPIESMSDNDMHDLSLLGWAFIRARN